MRLSRKQRRELAVLTWDRADTVAESDVVAFFAWSDRGIGDGGPLRVAKWQRDATLQVMKEDASCGLLFPADFDDDPPVVAEWYRERIWL